MKNLETNLAKAQAEYNTFFEATQSLLLATVNAEGEPNASYAPFIIDEEKNFYIYISGISVHTQNIVLTKKASVMLIEDETKSSQIFARKRLSFDCETFTVSEHAAEWPILVNAFSEKFGAIIEHFKGMADFILIKLTPKKGRFVIGFGMAYDVLSSNLNQLVPVSGGGHQSKNAGAPLTDAAKSRAVEHLNSDHADSVLAILKVYGGVNDCNNAKLVSISDSNFQVAIQQNGNAKEITIPFPNKINTADDLHKTFVQMSKKSKAVLQTGV